MLLKSGVDIKEFIEFRHEMHRIAEGGFECFNTHSLIKKKLHELGIRDSQIKTLAKTGMIVDIEGEGTESFHGPIQKIAFRADIDALNSEENNDLSYKSRTNHSHLCGHDGHTAILLAFTALV